MCFQIIWSLLCLEFKISGNKEILRCEKGLVTSQNIGSLLLFFAYGGLPREKKILRIWTGSSVNKKYIRDFWWEKRNGTMQDFSRQKTCISFAQLKTQFKTADFFFLWTIFPPKDFPRERNFVCRIAVGFFNGVDSLIDSFLAHITSYACACIFTTYYTRGVW